MDSIWRQLGFDVPDALELARVATKLPLAAVLGGAMGWERELKGKAAGLRTHMLVAVGAALFVMAPLEAGVPLGDLTRVMQGVAAGIGFVGAGAILKMTDQGQVVGLTTAAGIWMTAAVGLAVGAGRVWLPVVGVVIAVIILALLGYYRRPGAREGQDGESG
ncbi:MAG TPA: MgtC/SapB family protein [Methylomirabilota bacterium]|nr:MgtC/SapB family protein [Methylomirabilota bacterium]